VERAAARSELGLPAQGPVLLVAGALAGARSLNDAAVDAFGAEGPAVLHLTGERDYEQVCSRVDRPDYVVLPSTERFGAALSAADLALARAGGTVWELAAAGLPAVLVPYPHATADHQLQNARHFERAGGAVVLPDNELGSAPGVVRSLLADAARLDRMREAMLEAARPDAADAIAEELVALARR
jgi:UDP-N-acetylglucosamine--N-acetylmuramyl-(pentapeptide) pyrophosphoryl-undecaprenol N-acetylglucosamine transferase